MILIHNKLIYGVISCLKRNIENFIRDIYTSMYNIHLYWKKRCMYDLNFYSKKYNVP